MTWRVVSSPACQPDFRAASVEQGSVLLDELFAWVEEGPPRRDPWPIAGVVVYDEPLACGYTVSYFVEDADRYIAVIRLRRTRSA